MMNLREQIPASPNINLKQLTDFLSQIEMNEFYLLFLAKNLFIELELKELLMCL